MSLRSFDNWDLKQAALDDIALAERLEPIDRTKLGPIDPQSTCLGCGQSFTAREDLFDHLSKYVDHHRTFEPGGEDGERQRPIGGNWYDPFVGLAAQAETRGAFRKTCMHCNVEFENRNALFEHLEESGHARDFADPHQDEPGYKRPEESRSRDKGLKSRQRERERVEHNNRLEKLWDARDAKELTPEEFSRECKLLRAEWDEKEKKREEEKKKEREENGGLSREEEWRQKSKEAGRKFWERELEKQRKEKEERLRKKEEETLSKEKEEALRKEQEEFMKRQQEKQQQEQQKRKREANEAERVKRVKTELKTTCMVCGEKFSHRGELTRHINRTKHRLAMGLWHTTSHIADTEVLDAIQTGGA